MRLESTCQKLMTFAVKKMKTFPICTYFSPFAAILLKLINSSYIVFDYVLVTV